MRFDDRPLPKPNGRPEFPLLVTRALTAQLCLRNREDRAPGVRLGQPRHSTPLHSSTELLQRFFDAGARVVVEARSESRSSKGEWNGIEPDLCVGDARLFRKTRLLLESALQIANLSLRLGRFGPTPSRAVQPLREKDRAPT